MKLKLFSNLKISWLLAGGYIAMFFLMIIIGFTAFWTTDRLSTSIDRVFIGVPIMYDMSSMKSGLATAQAMETVMLSADPQSDAFDEALGSYGAAFIDANDGWKSAKDTIREYRGEALEGQEASDEQKLISTLEKHMSGWAKAGSGFTQEGATVTIDDVEAMSDFLFDSVDNLALLDSYFLEDAQKTAAIAETSRIKSKKRLIAVSAIGFLVAMFLSIVITRVIVRPLSELSRGMSRLANGKLDTKLNTASRTREMSLLMQGFSAMVATLRDQVSGLSDGANTIAVSTSQISTTATELASTASEASISVNQITTTAEEVKQTVQLSTEKANQVADAAEEVARVADQGRKATEDAVSGMSRIKEEMEYIAESIVKLSEQTQSIGEIIDAVNDLANESNLLSVNASIEAAKAGEFGKGFAVVAQEVKSLSDQSKQATAQVRTILNDIQNATSQAVMATERGSKAVDTGVDLASSSGNAIRALADSISGSAKSAAQIAASSRQQLAGMDQLAQAMGSIQDAAGQNVDGAKRLEDATRDLSEIADTLKDLANRFEL